MLHNVYVESFLSNPKGEMNMKKITLSKKGKIITAVTVAFLCVGGVVTYNVVTNNMQNESSSELNNIDLYYVPEAEKVFINGQLVPYNSKEFFIDSSQEVLYALNVEDGVLVEKDTLLYSCQKPQVLAEIDNLKYEIQSKYKEKNNSEDEDFKKSIDLEISNINDKINKLNNEVYTYVYAPFSGKVYLNEIDNDSKNNSVMTLESTDFYIKGSVNEYDSFKIQVDQTVEVILHATKEKFPGTISFVGNRPYSGSSSQESSSTSLVDYGVKIYVDQQSSFKNGLHVQGITEYTETNLRIPTTAVVKEDDKHYVYKVENHIAHKTEVTILEENSDFVVVNQGINQGEVIVRNLNKVQLQDGQNINEMPSEGVSAGE